MKKAADIRQRGLGGMARRFVSGLEFTGMSQANRCRERWRDLALAASRLEPGEDAP